MVGGAGGTCPLRRAFKGAPEQHWGASYETGNSVVMLSFASHSPIILAKNERSCKVELKKRKKDISMGAMALGFCFLRWTTGVGHQKEL